MSEIYWMIWALAWFAIISIKGSLEKCRQALESQMDLNRHQIEINKATSYELDLIKKRLEKI